MHRTQRPSNVEIRADDPSLTAHAGLLLTGELVARTNLIERLDLAIDAVRPFKQRRRGVTAGELLVSVAEMMAIGGDHLAHLEALRQDQASRSLRAVAQSPAPTTAGQLLPRLDHRQCNAAMAVMAAVGHEVDAQLGLTNGAPVTLDLDSTDSEVYGRGKQGAAFNYRGQRCYDAQIASWAERRRILAGELRSGNLNEHATSIAVLRRALQALPLDHGRVRARVDSGFFSIPFLHELRRRQVGFTISMPRTQILWDARLTIPSRAWRPALDMANAQIAELPFQPKGWKHETLRLIVRAVRVEVDELSQDPRSRRRRTIPKAQLQFALAGRVSYVYSYSFVLTDLEGDAAEIELWHRQRGQMEERVKELKLGCGLSHLPVASLDGNRAWMTAAVLTHNLVALLSATIAAVNRAQLQAHLADPVEPGPRRPWARAVHHNVAFLRRWLFNMAGRLVRGGRRVRLRLARGALWADTFTATYQRLRLLTSTA